ncbi:MAG: deoxyuridine 5'-triphosphate nucleotidohydrolase [Erysipelotrichaceae bacterium]|nr:deoxyuridine 5'-triphosphate nucleotidohydrolase [Erysipelotrichaceae bacterium]MDY5252040.1 deoxyuridine 5'-triphosphate nucleotidohydrolase [Erysipelotrichaceae bacterium]
MIRVGKFEKVSFEQFAKDYKDCFADATMDEIKDIYDKIQLPKRATKGSAGYDIYSPISFSLQPNEQIKFPTGIRVKMSEDWVFCIFPRSSWGFKFRLQMNNTVGIIDSDYYYSDNEGHIFHRITNDSKENKVFNIEQGVAITQGIFMPYGITEDDDVQEIRNGGLGSTTKK